MYIPRPFAVDEDTTHHLLRGMRAGHLVTSTAHGPLSTLLPLVLDAEGRTLVGHLARPNRQWRTTWQGQALVIAEGPNSYVSPSWYASKADHGRVVPTWNYVLLHVFGELVIHDDPAWVRDSVTRLTDHHEHSRPDPWSVSDAPVEYIEGQLRGIVGIEVRIERVEASIKMSQNKSDADTAGVITGLLADGHTEVAEWMRRSNS